MSKSKIMGWMVVLIWAIAAILVTRLLPPLLVWTVWIVGIIGFLLWLVYFVLAPKNIFFTFIPEGYAKVVVRAGKFQKTLIQWTGKTIDEHGNVVDVDGEEFHLFGGLRFYGWWPLDKIYEYKFKWISIDENGDFENRSEEMLGHVMLKPDVYGCLVRAAEDKDLIPLDLKLVLGMRVINPYKALFQIQNWYEAVLNRIRPYVRDFASTRQYAKLISQSERIGQQIRKKLEEGKIIDSFENEYGIEIVSLELKNIDPPQDVRERTLKKFSAQREAEARTEAITGALITMLSRETGMKEKEVKEKLLDGSFPQAVLERNLELLKRDMSLDRGALMDIRITGVDGLGGSLASFAAILGEGQKGKSGKPTEPAEEKKREKKTTEVAKEEPPDFFEEVIDDT